MLKGGETEIQPSCHYSVFPKQDYIITKKSVQKRNDIYYLNKTKLFIIMPARVQIF